MKKSGSTESGVPIDVADGIEGVQCSLECLAQAVECISVAVSSEREDSAQYIEGTMLVLLRAVRAADGEARALLELARPEAEG